MKQEEFKGRSKADLVKKLQALNLEVSELKIKNGLGQLTNPIQIRLARKNIARINTAINAMDLGVKK